MGKVKQGSPASLPRKRCRSVRPPIPALAPWASLNPLPQPAGRFLLSRFQTHYIANILYIKRALFGKAAERCLIPCFRSRLHFFDLTVIHDHFEHFLFQKRVFEKGHAVLILTIISL
jgi:hypothetical protein